MDIRHISRAGLVVMAAVLLVTFALAVAPVGVKAAFAQEAAAPAAKTTAAAATTTAAPAEGAEAKTGEGAEGAEGAEAEIPHKVGNPTPAQLEELRFAWASIPGFDLLVVAIIGLVITVGVIGFGVFKQMKA